EHFTASAECVVDTAKGEIEGNECLVNRSGLGIERQGFLEYPGGINQPVVVLAHQAEGVELTRLALVKLLLGLRPQGHEQSRSVVQYGDLSAWPSRRNYEKNQ